MNTDQSLSGLHGANSAVLADILPAKIDAMFIHGACIHDKYIYDAIVRNASNTFLNGVVNNLVINSTSDYGWYPRPEVWHGWLTDLGVPSESILTISPADKTPDESINLLRLADENGWKDVAISSVSHHQLRCFLQIVAEMQRDPLKKRRIYNKPTCGISWSRELTKRSINPSVKPVVGTFNVHCELEVQNISRYAVPFEDRAQVKDFTPHATIEEMFEYLRWRDQE